ncbi:hypothetical protein JOF53_002640 [Crossiella equi]|uniref:Uncharacterized protein n=1 Tax=Crossiella equi TaxID=130796 RepID=A0ABS5AB05_9PSEU|nr:hypothetical protein [Crossiella equi]MBP2473768.1 hypothetical protein [Crossiella equi]
MTDQNGSNRLAEEAKLLLDAVSDRALPWLQRLAAEAPEGHTAATCGWCPLCATLAVVRGERPELAVRAADHLAGLLGTLRAAMEERIPAAPSGDASPASSETGANEAPAEESAPAAPPRVQKITVEREC